MSTPQNKILSLDEKLIYGLTLWLKAYDKEINNPNKEIRMQFWRKNEFARMLRDEINKIGHWKNFSRGKDINLTLQNAPKDDF